MVTKPKVIWDKSAEDSFRRAYDRINEESPINAEKVRSEILSKTRKIADHPEMYPLDKFKSKNPGNYRAFETHSFRVAYRHTDQEIRILRFRHIRQEPRQY